ncbi:transposase zinc-binding domain-containing protein [Fusobacterium necrophorum]|uniref:transposase zinc-binding domain-containing protein n=1 Tax=Fusobacterium necrophorum TaxID=859 RepID=UPI003D6DB206
MNAFLLCADYQKAFVSFAWTQCGLTHKFPITYKTRLCPSYGYKYAKAWAHKMSQTLLNVPHHHLLFTIPKEARPFFCYDRKLLHKLTLGIKNILDYQFHKISKKKQRKNKIGKYSKNYFTNSDILHYDLITVIHTFGRDLKWNPHVHALVSP